MVAATSPGSSGKRDSTDKCEKKRMVGNQRDRALPVSAALASRKAGNHCTLEARSLLLIILLEGKERLPAPT